MKPFFAYMLRCAGGTLYTGHTDDLERRVAQHAAGECDGYTASRLPVELVWAHAFETREEALGWELRLKGWSRAKKEALIREDWQALKALARGPNRSERQARAGESGRSAGSVRPERSEAPFDSGRSACSVRPERSVAESRDAQGEREMSGDAQGERETSGDAQGDREMGESAGGEGECPAGEPGPRRARETHA